MALLEKTLKLVLTVVLVIISSAAFSANLFSRADGTWSTTNGGANCGCTPGQNDNITINHNITIAGSFVLNTGTLTVNTGTLTVTGDLTFNNGSFVTVAQNAGIVVNGNFLNKNNSNDIAINGSLKVNGNFQNGTGSGAGAVITVGPNGSITFTGSCNNPGTIIDNSGSYTGCTNGPLPVSWLLFEGVANGTSATLTWATATEKNVSHFEIERSADAVTFYTIGKVNAAGNSAQTLKYAFEDKSPLNGRNYYRLKSVDLDGYTEYYNDLVVLAFATPEQGFSVYPNPYRDGNLMVQLNFTPGTTTTVRIIDGMGNIRYATTTDEALTTLTPATLTAGFYILEVSNAREAHRQRIVVE